MIKSDDPPESRVDEIIKFSGVIPARIAEALGKDPSVISKWRKRQRVGSAADLLGPLLGVPKAAFYEPIGAPIPTLGSPAVEVPASMQRRPQLFGGSPCPEVVVSHQADDPYKRTIDTIWSMLDRDAREDIFNRVLLHFQAARDGRKSDDAA